MRRGNGAAMRPGRAGRGSRPSGGEGIPSRAGFTLLELIIVTTLALIILGLATLLFANTLPSARFAATGREIIAAMKDMKALAQNSGEDQTLIVNLDTGQYGPEGGTMKRVPAGITLKAEDPLSGEVQVGTYPFYFRAMGGVEGGVLVLTQKGKSQRLRTDPILGAVMERR
jgi:prepilin-type N-terminal cleavage/methylation domain-containing protein